MEFQGSAAARVAPTANESYRFSYHGEGGAFFVLLLKNILLTIVTLGIYAAWAKTNRRKYIWSNVELHGQRLKYTGTGKELFIAYLKLIGFYAIFRAFRSSSSGPSARRPRRWPRSRWSCR